MCIVTFILKNKLQKEHLFLQNMTLSSTVNASILNPSSNGNVHTYATISEKKNNAFTINSQNIKQQLAYK